MKLPEYGADLPRTFSLVVVPCSTAAPASAFAWDFHGSDSQSAYCPAGRASPDSGRPTRETTGRASTGTNDLKRISMALSSATVRVLPGAPGKPAAAGVYGKVARNPAISELIDTHLQGGVKLSWQ